MTTTTRLVVAATTTKIIKVLLKLLNFYALSKWEAMIEEILGKKVSVRCSKTILQLLVLDSDFS